VTGTHVVANVDEARRRATLRWLEGLRERVRAAVRAAGGGDDPAVDPFRGLFISPERAEELATVVSPQFEQSIPPLPDDALGELAARLDLDVIGLDIIMIAAAPDLDPRYEQLYGYLNDDVTRRRATTSLALRLTGSDITDPVARRRFEPDAPLRSLGLVVVDEPDRPFGSRSLRVPDRVIAALLGDDRVVSRTTRLVSDVTLEVSPWIRGLADVLDGVGVIHVEDRPEGTATELSTTAMVIARGSAVVTSLGPDPLAHRAEVVEAIREALLAGTGLVIGPTQAVVAAGRDAIDQLDQLHQPVIIVGRGRWQPEWGSVVPLTLTAPPLDDVQSSARWRRALDPVGSDPATSDLADPGRVTAAFRLGPERIDRAAAAAQLAAIHRGSPLTELDLHVGARLQNSSGLQRLARRIEPAAGWPDVVLPSAALASLRELTARVRLRRTVLDDWGMRRGGSHGDGITALFAGPTGTGKTLSAEVIARELGLDLHTVDLATVVDKYIGETEKNLDRIFDEAEQINTVLFFDEADALFGKRSEVRDARDRYANVEVAYLLQRMERFDGLAILATNLRLNMDEAFARRLDIVVDFPKPELGERRRLWKHLLGRSLPLDDTVDTEFLAASFELSGGDIRNVAVTAAYMAATANREVSMIDLVRGVGREYRKLGRLCLPQEFGRWYDALDETDLCEPVPQVAHVRVP
jgi:hypothetical protein